VAREQQSEDSDVSERDPEDILLIIFIIVFGLALVVPLAGLVMLAFGLPVH
jgi:hypothetical protein